jgi:hypothetical protein
LFGNPLFHDLSVAANKSLLSSHRDSSTFAQSFVQIRDVGADRASKLNISKTLRSRARISSNGSEYEDTFLNLLSQSRHSFLSRMRGR